MALCGDGFGRAGHFRVFSCAPALSAHALNTNSSVHLPLHTVFSPAAFVHTSQPACGHLVLVCHQLLFSPVVQFIQSTQVEEDTEALVLVGSNDLPVARAWKEATGVRPGDN